MILSELLNSVEIQSVSGNPESFDISGITNNSNGVKPNYIFAAIKGFTVDGHNYINDALSKGAKAVIFEDAEIYSNFPTKQSSFVKILVLNGRKALAQASNAYYRNPSQKLCLIGITGTKGKTTTSYYLKHILQNTGNKSGLIGTIANYIGDEKIETKLTTPESFSICELMDRMVKENCSHCIMEVSSHALSLYRVFGLSFDYGLFTNITSDHFDFHQDFENYLSAKKILFDNLESNSFSIINIDDANWPALVVNSRSHSIFYGKNKSALYKIKDIEFNLDGTNFIIEYNDEQHRISTGLIGEFNAYNAAAAAATAHQIGIDWDDLIKSLQSMPQVPGRFEVLSHKNKKVIVDYSHTTDSLKKALLSIRSMVDQNKKIYTVFGCGGDRDKFKRPEMGGIADELSDEIIITSDNPRTEDPFDIINDIKKGIKRKNPGVIENRDEAIKKAICDSEENSIILIAGKGHEDYQEINGKREHFSDKEKALKYLNIC